MGIYDEPENVYQNPFEQVEQVDDGNNKNPVFSTFANKTFLKEMPEDTK